MLSETEQTGTRFGLIGTLAARQTYAEVTNSLTQPTKLGYIFAVVEAFSKFAEIKKEIYESMLCRAHLHRLGFKADIL